MAKTAVLFFHVQSTSQWQIVAAIHTACGNKFFKILLVFFFEIKPKAYFVESDYILLVLKFANR